MIKKSYSIIILIFMLIISCFISVGYAQITKDTTIRGKVDIDIPEGLFITNVKTISTSNVSQNSVSFIEESTTVNSIIRRQGNSAGTVVYEITVFNNTKHEYAYRGLYFMSSYGSNSYVITTNNNNKLGVVVSFPNGKMVGVQEELTFRVTYTIGRRIGTNVTLDTLLNYQFGINVDSMDKATDIVHNKFLDILNTTTTYQTLVEALDDKFDGVQEWTSNYIGNVGNAVDNDMMTVETLFAGHLTMMVDGVEQKAWVIIKHENLDDNEMTGDDYTLRYNQYGNVTHKGCEMTLYMTVDPLDKSNGWAPVYATVFTCDRDENGNKISNWYQVGDSYYGEANIVGYNGEAGQTGSFVTDNWRTFNSTYQVTENYSYSTEAGVSIKDLMQVVDSRATAEFQNLLVKCEEMIANQKYAGTGIMVVEEGYSKASAYYTIDANGKAIAKQDIQRVWLLPIMHELEHDLNVAQEEIDKIEQGT